ncbi:MULTISPECIES: GNAT family N-acetyltransferase [unclassified Paludibacterium]|uniref:GNAT family N-acetyltransferase n=1 Tax=unclassified Paludibacterium TaxID=2618429 RepID=UPI001C054084|nr:GNAT family N-acetyltransferase [Paludibacterium sp. B53371]BEV70752.1 hypothetical protein THUN1379_02340 [Paludibacterium sp. THUN1379]
MPLRPFGWFQKSVQHHIELSHEQDILLRRAADLCGKTLSAFLHDSACAAAERTVLDQCQFYVRGHERQQLIALRQRPQPPSASLCHLMAQTPPWQSHSALLPPSELQLQHDTHAFDCDKIAMNDWLAHRAWQAQRNHSAKTFVVCVQQRVVAYFSLSVGQIDSREFPGHGQQIADRDHFPLPVAILTRLAVDKLYQHQGLGHALLAQAIRHVLAINQQAGVTALLTQPLNEQVARFYQGCGFVDSPAAYKQLFLPIEAMQAAVESQPA